MIRFAVEADIPEILEIYAPYVLNTAYSFEYTVPTLEEFKERFRSYTQQFPWLVWEEEGRVLGYAYGSRPWGRMAYSWNAEVSIYLAPAIHGRGIGRKLYDVLEEYARKGYYASNPLEKQKGLDILWFLWLNKNLAEILANA